MIFIQEMFRRPKFLATLIVGGGGLTWLGFARLQQPQIAAIGIATLLVLVAGLVLTFGPWGMNAPDRARGAQQPTQPTQPPSTEDEQPPR